MSDVKTENGGPWTWSDLHARIKPEWMDATVCVGTPIADPYEVGSIHFAESKDGTKIIILHNSTITKRTP